MSLWRNQREFPPRDRTQVDQIIEVKPFGQMLSEVYVSRTPGHVGRWDSTFQVTTEGAEAMFAFSLVSKKPYNLVFQKFQHSLVVLKKRDSSTGGILKAT